MSQVAVVTGAGSGVGRAVALELAKRGFSIALVGRRSDALEETIQIVGKSSGKLIAVACNVSSETDVAAMGQRVRDELGEVSVLVNSAGVNVARRALTELSVADWRHIIDVNLSGAFLCIHAFLPEMRRRREGTIVNVISDAGVMANRVSGAAYIAAKFGLTGLTGAVNAEERRNGIRACAVLPGEINTPLLDRRPTPPTAEARTKMLQAQDVAACVMLAIDLPQRATVEQILVRPREI